MSVVVPGAAAPVSVDETGGVVDAVVELLLPQAASPNALTLATSASPASLERGEMRTVEPPMFSPGTASDTRRA
jgi:hypothetical protein